MSAYPIETFLLGAGFSHAVDPVAMPLTAALGSQAIANLRREHDNPKRKHSAVCDGLSCDRPFLVDGRPPGDNFEVWMSRLLDAQPHLLPHEQLASRSLYEQLEREVASCVFEANGLACERRSFSDPTWFVPLLTRWHESLTNVVTLNYDTLVEARFDAMDLDVGYGSLYPSRIPSPLWTSPPERWETFRYMKLHGSINWWWDPTTRSADSMIDVGLPHRWSGGLNPTYEPARWAAGREPMLVPPTTSKTAFLENPVVRHTWREAFSSIVRARRLVLVGYSLPSYDLMVGALLSDAARERAGLEAVVVDPDAESIATRLEPLGFTVTDTYADVAAYAADCLV